VLQILLILRGGIPTGAPRSPRHRPARPAPL